MPQKLSQEELKQKLIERGIDKTLLETAIRDYNIDLQIIYDKSLPSIKYLWELCLLGGDTLTYLKNMHPDELLMRTHLEAMPVHLVARSGNIEAMQYLMQNPQFHTLLEKKNYSGCNIAHYAASSGNSAMLDLFQNTPPFHKMLDEKTRLSNTIVDCAATSRSPEVLNTALACMKIPSFGITRKAHVDVGMQTLDKALDSNFWLTEIKLPAGINTEIKSSIQKKLLRNKQNYDKAWKEVRIKNSAEFAKFVTHQDATVIEKFALNHEPPTSGNGLLGVALKQSSDTFVQFISKMSDSAFYRAAFGERTKGRNTPAQAVAACQDSMAFQAFIQRLDDTTLNRAVLDRNKQNCNMLQLAAGAQTDSDVFCNFIDRLNATTINAIVLSKSNESNTALRDALLCQSPRAFKALVSKMSSETLFQSIKETLSIKTNDSKSIKLNTIFLKFAQINACLEHDDTGDARRHWDVLHDAFAKDTSMKDIEAMIASSEKKQLSTPYCQLIKSLFPLINSPVSHYKAADATQFSTALGIYKSYLSQRPPIETQAQKLTQELQGLIKRIDGELDSLRQHSGLSLRLFYLDTIMQKEETRRVAKAALDLARAAENTPHLMQEKFTLFEQSLKNNPKWNHGSKYEFNEHAQTLIDRMRRFANNPSLNLVRGLSVTPATAAVAPRTTRTAIPTAPIIKPVMQEKKPTPQPIVNRVPTKTPLADKANALLEKLAQQKEELAKEIAEGESAQNFLSRFYYSRKNEVKKQKLSIITLAHQLIQNRLSEDPTDIAKRGQLRTDFNMALGENSSWNDGLFSRRTFALVCEVKTLMSDFMKQPTVPQPVQPKNMTPEKKYTNTDRETLVLQARAKYPSHAAQMKRQSIDEELHAWVCFVKGEKIPVAKKPVDSALDVKQLAHQLGQVSVPKTLDPIIPEPDRRTGLIAG